MFGISHERAFEIEKCDLSLVYTDSPDSGAATSLFSNSCGTHGCSIHCHAEGRIGRRDMYAMRYSALLRTVLLFVCIMKSNLTHLQLLLGDYLQQGA